jgi:membrane protease YdiL (CAAX protease family)
MFAFNKETGKDFLDFLKRPTEAADCEQTVERKAKRLFAILAIHFPIMGICLAINSCITSLVSINFENHRLTAILQQYPIWKVVCLVVVVAPFVEELVFRSYLRFKNNNLAQVISLIASLTGKNNKARTEIALSNFWLNHFSGIFYFSAVLFGFIHLTNYEFNFTILLLSPMLILPQFIAGLFLGYLRIKYDLILAYIMHAIHNAILLTLTLYLSQAQIS